LQAEGWELSWGPDEGSGADTDMGFELLSNDEHDDQSSDGSRDFDDPDLALRQKQQQQQRAYQPPEPTQVCPAPISAKITTCHLAIQNAVDALQAHAATVS
jgi:hypothetical protein